VVTLTANADLGWSFAGWSGDLSGLETQKAITIDGNKMVLAAFAQDEYTLTVNTSGAGSVIKNPDQPTYRYGDVVTLTASANLGWTFSHWSGDLTGISSTQFLTVTSNKTVTANFTQNDYSLTVSAGGNGHVGANPQQPHYHYGDVVTLTAVADAGWNFFRWTGDASGSANPKVITVNGDKNITAIFLQDGYVLLVSTTGEGSVEKAPWQDYFHYGDVVTLTATPCLDWIFGGWTGDASGSANPLTLVMTGSKSVAATFTRNVYSLTVNLVGDGSVFPETSQATYHYSDVVTLTATPATGASFIEWSGDLTGSANPQSILINGNKTVTAAFTALPHAVTELSFTFEPAAPKKNDPATFAATITPANATRPITYTWMFGDNSPQLITTTATVKHTFDLTGTFTVWLTATNGYGSPVAYHTDITVTDPTSEPNNHFIYMPIVIRQ